MAWVHLPELLGNLQLKSPITTRGWCHLQEVQLCSKPPFALSSFFPSCGSPFGSELHLPLTTLILAPIWSEKSLDLICSAFCRVTLFPIFSESKIVHLSKSWPHLWFWPYDILLWLDTTPSPSSWFVQKEGTQS